ncbi:hypothetical protein, partial [Haemophilus paraphrohaemolyticus]|uniref:hypothetical protein n=1 Tax=Haemophilus paraphrohaemolyticus TaxID=736 RepID=UPI0009C70006
CYQVVPLPLFSKEGLGEIWQKALPKKAVNFSIMFAKLSYIEEIDIAIKSPLTPPFSKEGDFYA